MEHKFSTLKQFKQITLSDEERAYLRGRLAQTVSAPTRAGEGLFQRGMQHGLRIALSSFLFVIFVGGSISAVASKALPGDPLYAVKTDVNERVKAALLSTPEEKVAFAKSRVESRVKEIKTLAETKTLTKEKQAKAQKALDENIEDLSAQLSVLSEDSPNSALSVTAHLEQNLKADKEAIQNTLETTGESATATATIKTIDGTLRKVSQEEVKILSKELDQISQELNATDVDTSGTVDGKEGIEGEVLGETSSVTPEAETITPVSP